MATLSGQPWTDIELRLLLREGRKNMSLAEWAKLQGRLFPGRTPNGARLQFERQMVVPTSPYPKYTDPLVMEQDALVLNDLEAPFHHAGFVNNCLALARAWGIKGLVLGGDFLHNDALSSFEPAFTEDTQTISPELADALLAAGVKGEAKNIIEAHRGEDAEPDHSEEMERAKGILLSVGRQFEEIHCIIGNHEGRLLRAIGTPLNPKHILKEVGIVDNPQWKIRPYYFCKVVSGGETFRVTHPKNLAKASAWKLASKFQEHILMAHNHQVVFQFDPSAQFYAIETGCAVDERLLPYAAQRDTTQHGHALGAVIVRGGIPWLLHERVDWERLLTL